MPLRQGISTLLTALMLVIVAITVVSVSTPGIARAQGEAPGGVSNILGAAQLAEGKELTVSLPTEPIVVGEGDGAVEIPVTFTLTGDTDTFAGAIVIYQAQGVGQRPAVNPGDWEYDPLLREGDDEIYHFQGFVSTDLVRTEMIRLPILDDHEREGDEALVVSIGSPEPGNPTRDRDLRFILEPSSVLITILDNDPPAQPMGLALTRDGSQVVLAWDDPGDATIAAYQYRYRPPDGSWTHWTDILDSDATTTAHTVTDLVDSGMYAFQVRPLGDSVDGIPSVETETKPMILQVPPNSGTPPSVPVAPSTVPVESGGTVQSPPLGPNVDGRVSIQTSGEGDVSYKLVSSGQMSPPQGYVLEGVGFDVTAPASSAEAPLRLVFELQTLESAVELAVFQNGAHTRDCSGPSGEATPDPCVVSRETGDGTVVVTVLATQSAVWRFGVAQPAPTLKGNPEAQSPIMSVRDGASSRSRMVQTARNRLTDLPGLPALDGRFPTWLIIVLAALGVLIVGRIALAVVRR